MAIIQQKTNSSLFLVIHLETVSWVGTYGKQQSFSSHTPSLLTIRSNSCRNTNRKTPTQCLSVTVQPVLNYSGRSPAIFWVIFIPCFLYTLSSSLHMLSAISGCAIAGVTERSITHQQPPPPKPCQRHFKQGCQSKYSINFHLSKLSAQDDVSTKGFQSFISK